MTNDLCPHCHSSRELGCKFGCSKKQPPRVDSWRSYDSWAGEQKEQRPWSKHSCPEEAG